MYDSVIRRANGYDSNSYTYYPVVVIGAGLSGVAMGCRLKEVLGFDQFRIFERQAGIGGTWWINRYPGVAVDIAAIFYSFSFAQNPEWTKFHPAGPEIVKYLQGVCEKYQMLDKIQLNTAVKELNWNDEENVWDITLQHLKGGMGDLSAHDRQQIVDQHGQEAVFLREEKIKAKVVVSAVGSLVEPKTWPDDIPGKDKFQGQIFHSARWRYDIDFKDKDVVVVGTGCSAAQFVPELTKTYGANSVTQIMRSPPWVVPRPTPPGGEEEWNRTAPWRNKYIPGHQSLLRLMSAALTEYDWRLFGKSDYGARERAKVEKQLLEHMKKTVPKKYWELLTPDYAVCGKRRIFDATWFPGLNDPKIELTTLPLSSVGEKSVTLGPRRTYPDPNDKTSQVPNEEMTLPADVIILANGFEIIKWLHPLEVKGRGGKRLLDVFEERGGPQMYMGTAMDGFPNFFALYGPNTATGHSSVVLAAENGISLSLKLMRPILAGDASEVEVKKQAEMDWTADMQEANKKTVFHQDGLRSWYRTDSGWNSTTYPYSQIWFTLRCMYPTWNHWDFKYTSQGIAKKSRRMVIRYAAYALAILGLYRARQNGYRLNDVPMLLRGYLRAIMLMGADLLQRIAGTV